MRAFLLVLAGIIVCAQASAAERTVTIRVEGMMCGADPHVVRDSLATLKGVKSVGISIENKTVAVIFDDGIVAVSDIVKATSVVGYPSTQLN